MGTCTQWRDCSHFRNRAGHREIVVRVFGLTVIAVLLARIHALERLANVRIGVQRCVVFETMRRRPRLMHVLDVKEHARMLRALADARTDRHQAIR